jgi:uncharacterized membrane protein
VTWKAGLEILFALALLYAAQPRSSVYMIEEAMTILLGIAVLLILVLLTVVAFLLLWEGARLVSLYLKWVLRLITGDGPLHAGRGMSHPFPGH